VTREESIRSGLNDVRDGIVLACGQSGRSVDEITLIAVSKFMSVQDIETAFNAGQLHFGENYAQELLVKASSPQLAGKPIRWHFQGGLQSRKVRDIIPVASTIQSVDRDSVIDELARRTDPAAPVDVFLEVNTGGEAQKSGAAPANAERLCRRLIQIPGVRLKGLMTIPPFLEDPEASRPYFVALRRLRDELRARLGASGDVLAGLSMGMTSDYKVAIQEGATVVRVGTAIFGARTP